jgi:electron transport complex protein RnfG
VALLLAQVNKMTAKPIAEAKALKLQNAIGQVVPEFENDPVAESYMIASEGGDSLLVYPATNGGEVVGFAISSSANGFAGEIQIMVGFDMDDKVVNYEILQHAETPGLGSKMGDWFKDIESSKSIIGRDMTLGALAVKNDGGDIDAITASTITSRAFLNAVNSAYNAYNGSKTDSYSSATNDSDDNDNDN